MEQPVAIQDDEGHDIGCVIVFGAAGFLGRALVANLLQAGHRVRAFERSEAAWQSWEDPQPHGAQVEHVYGDIVDFEAVSTAVKGCQAIVHSAVYFPPSVAQMMPDYALPSSITAESAEAEASCLKRRRLEPNIRTTRSENGNSNGGTAPVDDHDDHQAWLINLKGLYNVLEAAKLHSVRRTVHIGSCHYAHSQGIFFNADVRRPDGTLYAITKRLQEEMCRQHHEANGTRLLVLRPDYIVDSHSCRGRFGEELPGPPCADDGWTCRHDLAEAARLALLRGGDFDILHVVAATAPGHQAAEDTCNVARTREVLRWEPKANLKRFRPPPATTVDEAAQIVWDYLHVNHNLSPFDQQPADAILCLCSSDLRVATHAAALFKQGLGRWLLFAGGIGTGPHSGYNLMGWKQPEAEVFAEEARRCGVDAGCILIEPKSKNTGENVSLSQKLLSEQGILAKRLILVQKPFMERRTYATFMKQWPVKPVPYIAISSPPISWEAYPQGSGVSRDAIMHIMLGDMQRIKLYARPPTDFQIPQHIPPHAWKAYEFLVSKGYTDNLAKE